ncbi:hypothetical protein NQ662_18700 [Acinetobacter baumannii]|nr:hypothetical protein [Acinetobacter baumannii]
MELTQNNLQARADVHRKLGEKLNIIGGAAASTPVAKTSGENVITRTTKDGIQIERLCCTNLSVKAFSAI